MGLHQLRKLAVEAFLATEEVEPVRLGAAFVVRVRVYDEGGGGD